VRGTVCLAYTKFERGTTECSAYTEYKLNIVPRTLSISLNFGNFPPEYNEIFILRKNPVAGKVVTYGQEV
jgi:hypothetical protein